MEKPTEKSASLPVAMRVANALDRVAMYLEGRFARGITGKLFGSGSGPGAGIGLGLIDRAIGRPLAFPLEKMADGVDALCGSSRITVRELKSIVRQRVGKIEDFCGRSEANAALWRELNALGCQRASLDRGSLDVDSDATIDRFEAQRLLTRLELLLVTSEDQ